MSKRKKVRELRVLLIKDGYKTDKHILSDIDKVTRYELKDSLPFKGALFVQEPLVNPPKWLSFVQSGTASKIAKLTNASNAAVLLIESAKRRFAFTFGYGRNLLDPESYERDFGLKVALNTIDPDNLRSMDARTFEELTLHTRRQTSRGAALETFGLNITQDLLRSVTGKPSDAAFARRVAGSDGLMLAVPIDFPELGPKCKDLLTAYASDKYKERFEFIDHIHAIRDPSKIAELNKQLVDQLAKNDTSGAHLAPPEPLNWEEIEGFTFSSANDDAPNVELEIAEFLKTVENQGNISLDLLKTIRVGVVPVGAERGHSKWSAFRCIVFEVQADDVLYVLTDGEWYEVAKGFLGQINKRVKEIAANPLSLPNAKSDETEGQYNSRIAKLDGRILMDVKLQRIGGSKIEFCDVFTGQKQLIHVKKKTRSATLSHLFAQGVVSAETFIADDDFRKAVKATVGKVNATAAKLIPDERPVPGEYTIVYAIIGGASKNWPLSLPFFSRLNLMNAADHLGRLSFKVSLTRIDKEKN